MKCVQIFRPHPHASNHAHFCANLAVKQTLQLLIHKIIYDDKPSNRWDYAHLPDKMGGGGPVFNGCPFVAQQLIGFWLLSHKNRN